MANLSKTALLAALLIPGAALAQINVGDQLGASETAIQAALEAQGYTVTEIEVEDGEIEVEATSGGQSFEFEVSPETGLVLAAYQEDEEDGEEDDDDEGDDDDEDGEDTDDDDD
ncbi:MAG: PepSY domain-containing protein [Pseudomonadota bacterium]